MKTLLVSIALIISSISFAQDNAGITIEVSTDNVLNGNGMVVYALHNSKTFMVTQGIKSAESTIADGKAKVTFENVEPGTYAVIALHDENENGRMDFETNGMPKESYGSSNNPMSYGPPQFGASKFEVTKDDIALNIRF